MSDVDVTTRQPVPALFGPEDAAPVKKARKHKSAAEQAVLDDHLPRNLGKALKVKVPDFSDPNRPKTCLEVDFPIVPINALSALEGNAGKPIYQMSKWWARRRSCVFRALLLAAAMEAPTRKHPDGKPMIGLDGKPIVDEDAAAQLVWDAYYANHQLAGNFKNLKVLDPFMGGGTTLVEGSRLGFQVAGVDLNPVAWFIVKNELACTDPAEVKAFFDQIEAEVKPQVQPFYVTDGVGGRKGAWFKVAGDGALERMPADFDPARLPHDQRKAYIYEGPEVIYTFWAKHGPCIKPGCGHRTPIFRSPVVATKKLGVKYLECTCKKCKTAFHAELGDARIAPDAEHVVLNTEQNYTVVSGKFAKAMLDYDKGERKETDARIEFLAAYLETEPGLKCPRCGEFAGQFVRDILAKHASATRYSEVKKKDFNILPKGVSKKPVYCTLLIDPEWLKGSPGEIDGKELGGYIDAPVEATEAWHRARLKNLRLIEVRGSTSRAALADSEAGTTPGSTEEEAEQQEKSSIPASITLKDGREINTRAETIARKANGKEWDSHFVCGACGTPQDIREAVQRTRRSAPVAPYALQVYDAKRDHEGRPYAGRFFKAPDRSDVTRAIAAEREWTMRRDDDLNGCWPREEIPRTYMTHQANFALPEQGYTHWYKMFNPRQLLGHATLLKTVVSAPVAQPVRDQALGAIQQFLRNQNTFAIWNIQADKLEPFFSNSNYAPKDRFIENSFFGALGRGNWLSCATGVVEGVEWASSPWEVAPPETRRKADDARLAMTDAVLPGCDLRCGSSSELPFKEPFDLVITDPPFGDNLYYSDLANFFHSWLRLPLRIIYPELFGATKTPSAQEALKPRWLNEADGDQYYYDRLMPCWDAASRQMKDGGILAFTFHHSEDSQWEIVLRSLFDAGLYLEATFPIASDEMKGEGGQFGAKGTEYDIIHVCRKRLKDPTPVSWPKMRQWVKAELARLRPLLESFKTRGLSDADVRVILRGKALEFYSRHYGRVTISAPGSEDALLSIREALLGINQLLDESSGVTSERPPSIVQPVVFWFLRYFGTQASYTSTDIRKHLRGTLMDVGVFERHGWVVEREKVVSRIPMYDHFRKLVRRPRREMKTELDQAHFLIGAALGARSEDDPRVNIEEELQRETFLVRPGVEALLDWYSRMAGEVDEPDIPRAAGVALQLLRAAFEAKRARMHQEDPTLFEEWEASMAISSA